MSESSCPQLLLDLLELVLVLLLLAALLFPVNRCSRFHLVPGQYMSPKSGSLQFLDRLICKSVLQERVGWRYPNEC